MECKDIHCILKWLTRIILTLYFKNAFSVSQAVTEKCKFLIFSEIEILEFCTIFYNTFFFKQKNAAIFKSKYDEIFSIFLIITKFIFFKQNIFRYFQQSNLLIMHYINITENGHFTVMFNQK